LLDQHLTPELGVELFPDASLREFINHTEKRSARM
jgi:hypothetical protein